MTTGKVGVIQDEEFGGIFIDLTIEGFNALGFSYGDSVDISFDNGITLEDIPYYTGYYAPVNELLLCAYPGSPHVKLARNYGDPTWDEFRMTKDSKATVTMNEKAKYLSTQELNKLEYSDNREDYGSDIIFANFREVEGGNLRKKRFYRSASPCDNQHNRAPYANALAEEYGVRFVINLSDNETKKAFYTKEEDFVSRYYDELYRNGNVLLLCLNVNYRSEEFSKAISHAFLEMTSHRAPCLIHCVEGKDRTGFACTLLLALADATPDQIIANYLVTYRNYFGITKENDPEKYNAILIIFYSSDVDRYPGNNVPGMAIGNRPRIFTDDYTLADYVPAHTPLVNTTEISSTEIISGTNITLSFSRTGGYTEEDPQYVVSVYKDSELIGSMDHDNPSHVLLYPSSKRQLRFRMYGQRLSRAGIQEIL